MSRANTYLCPQHIQTEWQDCDESRAPSKSCSLTAIVFRPLALSPPSTPLESKRDTWSPSRPAGRLMFSICAVPQTSYFHCYDCIFNVPIFNGSKLPDIPALAWEVLLSGNYSSAASWAGVKIGPDSPRAICIPPSSVSTWDSPHLRGNKSMALQTNW